MAGSLHGRLPGRNFAEYLTSIGITEKEKVFHSFRHTFNDNLKQIALLGEEARSELTGHAHHGINSLVYSSTHRMMNKFEFIKGLRFEDVSFEHLAYQEGQFSAQSLVQISARSRKAPSEQRLAAKLAREERYRETGKPLPK